MHSNRQVIELENGHVRGKNNGPVTYSWENIQVGVNVVHGNVFNRKGKSITRKCILDNGNTP